ncbi:MAG: TIM barrel protein [Methanomassiliicoccaceae archaeon]|nr:TIM barrel protein [Methanomassiliicoccaceae archaeon]
MMEHLFSISAYDFDLNEYGGMHDAIRKIRDSGADGIELLTGYFDPDTAFNGIVKGIHLPYATDWYSPWIGDMRYIDTVEEENIKYRSYGRNKNEMIKTIRKAIDHASVLLPEYGVFHASNTRMDEVMSFSHKDSDDDVLSAVADLLNNVAKTFVNGEPPFKLLLENLWWPGLTMKDDSGYRMLSEKLEFDNWGLCLDTGHLMNYLGHCREEEKSINDVLKIISSYPREMNERIELIHLHMSLSADYTERCVEHPVNFEITNDNDMISKAYEHVVNIDQHRPFTNKLCTKIVSLLKPNYVTHEISGKTANERLKGFTEQLSLFSKM